jgi:hypothetical protein
LILKRVEDDLRQIVAFAEERGEKVTDNAILVAFFELCAFHTHVVDREALFRLGGERRAHYMHVLAVLIDMQLVDQFKASYIDLYNSRQSVYAEFDFGVNDEEARAGLGARAATHVARALRLEDKTELLAATAFELGFSVAVLVKELEIDVDA